MRAAVIALVLMCALAPSARADRAADARKHEAAGFSHFQAQRYDQAIASWRAAYEITNKAILLYDIALAYQRKPDARAAIEYFERYLAAEPEGDVASEARAAVTTLRRELEEVARKQAEPIVRQAEAYAAAGAWSEAAAEYAKAYALTRDPELLFHIAEAHRQRGDGETAARSYREYLDAAPAGPSAAAARAALAELARSIDLEGQARQRTAQAAAAASRAAEAAEHAAEAADRAERSAERADKIETERAAREADRFALAAETALRDAREADRLAGTDDARRRVEEAGVSARQARDSAVRAQAAIAIAETARAGLRKRSRRGRSLRIAGIITAAGGAVLTVVGVAYGVHARNLSDEVSSAPVWSPELDAKVSDGEAAERNAIVLGSVGAAAIITGAVLYVVGVTQGRVEREPVALVPRLGPRTATLTFEGRF